MRAVTDDGSVVWEGRVSPQLTLDGVVLGDDDVQVDSATWLSMAVPYEAFVTLYTEVETGTEPPPEYVSVGRVSVLGTPDEDNVTTLIAVVGAFVVVAGVCLLTRRAARSRTQPDGASGELPGTLEAPASRFASHPIRGDRGVPNGRAEP